MKLDLNDLNWRDSVLECVRQQSQRKFSVQDMYDHFTDALQQRFPKNKHIKAGIRRELQHLRDDGLLAQSEERGHWLYLAAVFKQVPEFDVKSFTINTTPLPNRPISQLWETKTEYDFEGKRDHEADVYLGSIGETVIFHNERKRLSDLGHSDLAKKVEQVSKAKGDSLGYDILSYDDTGREKWIEVKTTKGRISSRFFISENQIRISQKHPEKYWLYRLYDFDFENQRASMYRVPGPLREKLDLRPNKYSALPYATRY